MRPALWHLFKKSPFKPLREHMSKSMECASQLKPMFDALLEGDYEKLQRIADEVFKLEHEADLIKNEIRDNLPRKIFLPVDRTDFLVYLAEQDAIPDKVEDIAVLLTLKKLVIPEAIRSSLYELIDRVLHCLNLAYKLTEEFDRLLEASFGDKEAEKVIQIADELDYSEWRADKKQYEVAKILLELENQISPVTCMLWFNIFKELGALANHAERLGKRLRLMLSKA
jgi:hypothetical protein